LAELRQSCGVFGKEDLVSAASIDPILVVAFRRILRPLVKVLIRAGVRFEDFVKLAKDAYAESAIRDGSGVIGDATLAKLSLATGLSVPDLTQFVAETEKAPAPRSTLSALLIEVLSLWHTESAYVGPYGIPLELKVGRGDGRGFGDLVSSVDPSLDTDVILEALMRAGCVERAGDGYVRAVSRVLFFSEPMAPAMLEWFGITITNLMSTLEHNMDPMVPKKRLQRSVFADRGLTDRQAHEFQRYASAKVHDLLVDLDNWLADIDSKMPDERSPRSDIGISVFQYVRTRERDIPIRELFDLIRKP
jgi:hypothetical protein